MSRAAPAAPAGFEAFYLEHYGRVVRLAWLLTGSIGVAEDVAQDAFLSVQRRYLSIEHPVGYLNQTVVNRARTWRRDEHRRQLKLQRAETEETLAPDPADADLLDAVRRLPYRQRTVIVARYWAGWSEREIAEALGCRQGTIKSLASRAIAHLRNEVPL